MKLYQAILECKMSFSKIEDRDARRLIKHLCEPNLTKRYGVVEGGSDLIKQHRFFNINWEKIQKRSSVCSTSTESNDTSPCAGDGNSSTSSPSLKNPENIEFEEFTSNYDDSWCPTIPATSDPFLSWF